MEECSKLEDVFAEFSRNPKNLLTQLKALCNPQTSYTLPSGVVHGLTMKLLTDIQGHLNRELKKRNGEFVSVLLSVLSGVTKYQMEELNVKPPADVVKRTADMIIYSLEKICDLTINNQWKIAINQAATLVSLLTECKPLGLGECMLSLMKLSQNPQLDVETKVKVCNAINETWEVYSIQVKDQLDSGGHLMNYCKMWLTSLPRAGDYELQLQLLEAVFRLTDAKRRNVLSKGCFANQQLAKQFLKIDPRELDVGSRIFLNALNSSEGAEASVSSLPCLTFVLGSLNIPKPAEADDFWIDFNFHSKSLSTYVDESSDLPNEEATWIDIVVKSGNVDMYRLQAAQESIVLLLSLKDQASSLLPGRTILGDSKMLKVTFHGQYYANQLSRSLEKVFGRMLFSPQLALSSTTEHAVARRKVSQAPVYVLISSKKTYTPVCQVSPAPKPQTPKPPKSTSPTPQVSATISTHKKTSVPALQQHQTEPNPEKAVPNRGHSTPTSKTNITVSPIYASPSKTDSLIIPAKKVITPPNRPIPSCSPKTSTPKRFNQTLEDSLPSAKNNKQVLSKQETREAIPPKEDSSTQRDSVESDFKKVTEKLPDRNRTKRTQSRKASENVHKVKVPSADCGAKEENNKLSRKPLQNITNKHGPARKQKKPTVSIDDDLPVELDVVQDSMPMMEKVPKKKNKQPKTTKGNTTAKCAPPKRSRSPGWTLNLSTRSLATAGSANVSRTSSAMDQDPYQFDSDDVTEQLHVPFKKRVIKKPSKWHEKDTSVKSTKKVYSNKGKLQRSHVNSFQCISFNDTLEDVQQEKKPSKVKEIKPKMNKKPSRQTKMSIVSEEESITLSDDSTDDTYLPTGERRLKKSNSKMEARKDNHQNEDYVSTVEKTTVGRVAEHRSKASKPKAKVAHIQAHLKPYTSPAEAKIPESCTPESSALDKHCAQMDTKKHFTRKESSLQKVSDYLASLTPSDCCGVDEIPGVDLQCAASFKEGVSEIISLPYPDVCPHGTSRDTVKVHATPSGNKHADEDVSSVYHDWDETEISDPPEQKEYLQDITLEFAAHCNNIIAQSEKGGEINSPEKRQGHNVKPKKGALSSCPRKRTSATHFKQEHKKAKKLQTRVVPLTPLSEVPVTAEDEYHISIASGPTRQDDVVSLGGIGYNESPHNNGILDPVSIPSIESASGFQNEIMSQSEDLRDFRYQQRQQNPYPGLLRKRNVMEQDSMLQVIRSTTKTAHRHASTLWKLQSGEWRSLVERYSKDLYSVVSSIEDDVGSTCRSLGGIQKIITAAENEHVTLVHTLTDQEDKLEDLTRTQQSFMRDWKKVGITISHKKTAITGNLRKEVEHILREFSTKAQQEDMEKIRYSVQNWLISNL